MSNSIKAEQAQEHANHIGRVLGLSDDDVRLSGLATYLEKYVMQALGSWQEIESCPQKTLVLLCELSGKRFVGMRNEYGWISVPGSWSLHPLWWQPLPSPPSSTEHGGEK